MRRVSIIRRVMKQIKNFIKSLESTNVLAEKYKVSRRLIRHIRHLERNKEIMERVL
jgi:hypothetical protein